MATVGPATAEEEEDPAKTLDRGSNYPKNTKDEHPKVVQLHFKAAGKQHKTQQTCPRRFKGQDCSKNAVIVMRDVPHSANSSN
eukprot:762788-Hanusia_phi.AAC.2